MAKKKSTTLELTIHIRNKDAGKLFKIRDWVEGQLDMWKHDKELPMQGTNWDDPTTLAVVEDNW